MFGVIAFVEYKKCSVSFVTGPRYACTDDQVGGAREEVRKWTWRNCAGAGSHPVGINEIPHARARRAARVAPIRLPQAIATRGGHGEERSCGVRQRSLAAGEGSHRTAWPQFEVFAYRYAPSPPTHPHPRGCTQVTSAVTAVFPATAATGQYHRGCHAVRFPHVDPSATRTMPVRTEGGRAHVSSLPHPLHARPLTSPRAPLASLPHPSCSRSSHPPLSSSYRRGSTPRASARPSSPVPPP